MAKHRNIRVRGGQRKNIDPAALLPVLLALAEGGERSHTTADSPDVFGAAIEDLWQSPSGEDAQ
ncbi:hypothetical protein [Mycobacteroides abscessus]|uniref:hypothetical protein n=1 Tax=Mycobacteroides abscessus TaxID=36809 RepID=UPI0011BE0AB8|nr:hypothetical protein [Mycobacteroides abscessus]